MTKPDAEQYAAELFAQHGSMYIDVAEFLCENDPGLLEVLFRERSARLREIRSKLESIVCTEGEDSGVVLLSYDGPTHTEIINGRPVQVYDHEYFSPLGDALMELYKLTEQPAAAASSAPSPSEPADSAGG